ncbi:hypothetical protein PIB30_067085 [Stylosanthes scabra]|uniref:Uncharacterized protein n=1 Tax=Stylosanthes scabra TaxID=79078 RepID=A0ABU6TP29_9FABA|nr:hypothetical protein [Stylosanthes scabra]
MASSLAPVSVFDEHHFRKEFNQELFYSHARKRKVIPEVGLNLNEDEYPQIMEQVSLRGWRRLAAPCKSISDEEAAEQDELPYKSFMRGIKVDFSPSNIRRVMRFKSTTEGAETDYNTHKAIDQRLCEGYFGSYMEVELKSTCCPHSTQEHRTSSISQRLARVHNPLTCSNGEQIGSHNNSSRIDKQGKPCPSKHNLQIVQGCRCSFEGI